LHIIATVELSDEIFSRLDLGARVILPQLVCLDIAEDKDRVKGSFLCLVCKLLENGGSSLISRKPITGVLEVGKNRSFRLVFATILSKHCLS
jgi:hypothetical protein